MFGAPIAASLLALDGLFGLAGWQWLFVVEGLPTIALGLYIARTLAPSPAQAAFLTPEEREWLCARNARIKACSTLLRLHRSSGKQCSAWVVHAAPVRQDMCTPALHMHAKVHGQVKEGFFIGG